MSYCAHVAGVTCDNCRFQKTAQPTFGWWSYALPSPSPVKCPDCGVWWRTWTHECAEPEEEK